MMALTGQQVDETITLETNFSRFLRCPMHLRQPPLVDADKEWAEQAMRDGFVDWIRKH